MELWRKQQTNKLRVQVQSGKQYDYEPGASLLEILLAQNIFIDNPCNGKGVCGKCKVRIVSVMKQGKSLKQKGAS